MFDIMILGDSMKITKIQKMRSGKYKIELDYHEKITTYDEVILKNNLLFKKEIDNDLYHQIIKDSNAYDGYYKAMKYITTKMRSEKELKNYLDKYEIPKEEQESIIQKLKENGFLNDNSYVKAFVADKIHLSNMGPYQIRKELEDHNIASDVIIKELEQYDPDIFTQKLRKLAIKKVASNHKYSKFQLQQKLTQEFIRLGYREEQIRQVLDSISYSDEATLEKEWNTLYRKLSKKYQGKELEMHLKNKLYQKGFSMSDINEKWGSIE